MGQRTIDTILRVQNESDYKRAVKECGNELKTLKSELDLVTTEFRTNANSMEALTSKGEVLSNMYKVQKAQIEQLEKVVKQSEKTREKENAEVDRLAAEYEDAKKSLDAYGKEVDKSNEGYQEAKAKVDALRDAHIKHNTKLSSAITEYTKYSTQLNKAKIELANLDDKQAENARLMEEARQSADGCATSIDRYGDAVCKAADGADQSASAVEALASQMVASGIQQKMEDLASKMIECSEAAQEFEVSLAQVGTISDDAIVSQEEMRKGVLNLSTELRKDANEVADAAYEALSAGVDTADVLSFTAQSSQLATAGFTDMSTSVDVLTTILNAYKLEADQTEKVASTLVKTQDLGKVTVDDLGKVIGRVIPSATAYGVNLDNIATAYANMTASGINAENTTTYLSTMLDELADSGSDVAAVLLEETGKSFAELMAEGNSLGDVLEIIGGSVEYDNVQFSNLWSSSTAGKAAISLFDGSAAAFNATLQEMADSSGTLTKNYEKMTDVSEYSSQRLEVASKNLSIAVGDQLNPVLDKLRESGAGILEKAAQVVADNPALISVIAGTVTALGLLAGGLSALMIVKSVTTAMQALNITLAANPIGLVAVGVAGLVAALATFVAQSESAREEVEQLTEASRTLSETVETGNTTYEDTMVSAEAAAATVDSYIDRLERLEQQGVNTDAQQLEYAMLLERINTVMPGLNTELDEQTGLVKGGAAALRDQAAAWKQNAIAEAAYTRYKEDIAAMADAEYELAKNEALLSTARKDHAEIHRKAQEVAEKQAEAYERQQYLLENVTGNTDEWSAELEAARQECYDLGSQLYDLNEDLSENEAQQATLKDAIDEGKKTIEENRTEVEAAEQAYADLSDQVENSSDEVGNSVQDMANETADATQKMQEAYDELYTSARESLEQQIGLFDDLSGKCEMSMDEMIENLHSQKIAFDNYATNIQTAMERGIDMGLIQKLSDGSVESMQILEVLVNGTEAQIDELNEVFLEAGVSKDDAAASMAGFNQALEETLAESADIAVEGGKNIGNGWITGVKSKANEYLAEIRNLAHEGQREYMRVNEQHSPSRKYRKFAENDVQGLIVQYKADTPKLKAATANLANAGYLSMIRSRQAAIPSLTSMAVSSTGKSDNTQLYTLLQQILSSIKDGKKLVIYPDVLVGQTVGQYDAALGQRSLLAERGAR